MVKTSKQIIDKAQGKSDKSYSDLLKDGRWDDRRKGILKGHPFCNSCKRNGVTLQVHHVNYVFGKMPWDYEDSELVVLCEDCHDRFHKSIKAIREIGSFSNATDFAAIAGLLTQLCDRFGLRNSALKIASLL